MLSFIGRVSMLCCKGRSASSAKVWSPLGLLDDGELVHAGNFVDLRDRVSKVNSPV